MKESKRNYLLLVMVFASMLTISIAENAKGIFVPAFKENFRIDDVSIGIMLFLSSCSYMLGTMLAGYLIDLISRKRTMLAGVFLLMTGIFLIIRTNQSLFFYMSFVLSNVGMAFLGLSVNTLIPRLGLRNAAVVMNLVHFFYGIGATATHKSFGLLLSKGFSYAEIYYSLLAMSGLLFLLIASSKFKEEKGEEIRAKIRFTARDKALILILGIGLGLYISAEIQTGNWIIDYIKTAMGYDENTASNYSSFFFLSFALGRLFGGIVAEKAGYLRSVIASLILAFLLYFFGLRSGASGLLFLSASGLFFAIVFPTVMLSVSKIFPNSLNKASGVVVSIASGTNMLMGFVIGYSSKQVGIGITMYWIPTCLLVSAALLFWAGRRSSGYHGTVRQTGTASQTETEN